MEGNRGEVKKKEWDLGRSEVVGELGGPPAAPFFESRLRTLSVTAPGEANSCQWLSFVGCERASAEFLPEKWE